MLPNFQLAINTVDICQTSEAKSLLKTIGPKVKGSIITIVAFKAYKIMYEGKP